MLWQQIDINIINILYTFRFKRHIHGHCFVMLPVNKNKKKKKKRSDVVFMIIIITFVIYFVSEVLIDSLSSDQIWR